MQIVASLIVALLVYPQQQPPSQSVRSAPRQLLAVRGEVVTVKKQAARMLAITIKPTRDFAEVIVTAHENDLVGSAVRRSADVDLLSLLGDESRGHETITAAELGEGDVVSVIFDPLTENRSLEIYLH